MAEKNKNSSITHTWKGENGLMEQKYFKIVCQSRLDVRIYESTFHIKFFRSEVPRLWDWN